MLNRWHMAKVVSVAALAVVLTGGAASATTLRASAGHQAEGRHHGHDHRFPQGVFGTVASVNGTSTTGACGMADNPGVFTLNGHDDTTFTVDVSTTTTFTEHGVSTPTFVDVCVGGRVGALGMNSGGTVTATAVFVVPPPPPPPTPKPHAVFGTVASVNGANTTGACGMADNAGVFTLNAEHNKTFTVDVSTTTTFNEHGVASASFGDVCVGGRVGAFGLISSGTVTATAVFITPLEASPPHHATLEPSNGSGPEGSTKVAHPNGHSQGHPGGSGSGQGDRSHSSGNGSGHHDS